MKRTLGFVRTYLGYMVGFCSENHIIIMDLWSVHTVNIVIQLVLNNLY